MWFEIVCVLSLASGSFPHVSALAPPVLVVDAVKPVPKDAVSSVPKLETARAQLDFADELRRGLRSVEEPARKVARIRAADAYRAVREHFGGDAGSCAEAAFRRADLLRQSGDIESARAEYGVARERGADTPWRVRGALELGHLERRAKRLPQALSAYEAVIADAAAGPGQRDDASLWTARALADMGRSADAIRTWTRVADSADDPLDRIRAHDQWAQELIARADLEGAAGVLARANEKLAEAAQEESRLGERVRAALSNMRAIEELARAIAEARPREQ